MLLPMHMHMQLQLHIQLQLQLQLQSPCIAKYHCKSCFWFFYFYFCAQLIKSIRSQPTGKKVAGKKPTPKQKEADANELLRQKIIVR